MLDYSKLKEFADHFPRFDENGGKFSKWVEKTLWEKQFLLFPQHFQKICIADTYKQGLVWERVKSYSGAKK